jgi:phosphoribosylformylglycinamidine synthase
MAARLEIALKDHLTDAEGEGIRQKALDYFGMKLLRVRSIHILTIDAELSHAKLKQIQTEIFTNPVTQLSSFEPLNFPFDWTVWVGYRPGVRDNPGSTAVEAVEDLLGIRLAPNEAIYTSRRYCIEGGELVAADLDKIAGELLANDIIQQWKIVAAKDWDPENGIGLIIPKVRLDHDRTYHSQGSA